MAKLSDTQRVILSAAAQRVMAPARPEVQRCGPHPPGWILPAWAAASNAAGRSTGLLCAECESLTEVCPGRLACERELEDALSLPPPVQAAGGLPKRLV
jgi:hypothetical protein